MAPYPVSKTVDEMRDRVTEWKAPGSILGIPFEILSIGIGVAAFMGIGLMFIFVIMLITKAYLFCRRRALANKRKDEERKEVARRTRRRSTVRRKSSAALISLKGPVGL